ncbi:hypothetical protein EBR96_06615 [bacterium]|nr:hypothetical protein [bacterium]
MKKNDIAKSGGDPIQTLEDIRAEINSIMQQEFSSVIVTNMTGTRIGSNRYQYAIFTNEKISLFQKSSSTAKRFEFDFATHSLQSTPPENIEMGSFTETLAKLLAEVHKGKATVVKKR